MGGFTYTGMINGRFCIVVNGEVTAYVDETGFHGDGQHLSGISANGLSGLPGKDGVDGKDGYTPVKGVDYSDGKDGVSGKDGANGLDSTVPGPKGDAGAPGKDGTNGTTPVKGVDYFDGIKGNPGPAGAATWDAIVQVAGTDATTTLQSLADVTGLTVPLLANSQYEFEAILRCATTAVATGTKYGVQFSAAGATAYAVYVGAVTSTTGAATSTNVLNSADATAFLTTSAMTGLVTIKGMVVTGANPGNLTIQHLKVTSGTSTVKIGSMLKVRKI